jgi:hypothetical protein
VVVVSQSDHVEVTVVRSTQERAKFAVRDLAPGGARLVGKLELFEGEHVQLELALDEPLQVFADVTRIDRQRRVIEVEFRGLTGDALAQIEAAISAMLERVRATAAPTVLIVHPALEVSSALERDLARVGVGARVIGTLAELADQLDDRTAKLVGLIFAGSFGDPVGPALEQLEAKHPGVRRVILFGDQIDKIEHPAANRVDAVLRTPWRFKGLARALDLPLDDVKTTYDQLVALQMPIGKKTE